jgi:hypothetical protein
MKKRRIALGIAIFTVSIIASFAIFVYIDMHISDEKIKNVIISDNIKVTNKDVIYWGFSYGIYYRLEMEDFNCQLSFEKLFLLKTSFEKAYCVSNTRFIEDYPSCIRTFSKDGINNVTVDVNINNENKHLRARMWSNKELINILSSENYNKLKYRIIVLNGDL